uniref:DNA-binding transcriptional regulator, XRE-family HTH domain n=1 Tax=Candidatus Kentrum sp. SD TaxID=2126332 RepID=A0A451BQR8_9GAMM|nr:MAG: DNA-binding transcriptional regulator, XRE-family HTH domain [Candidatus Kentron sp. SD]VFK48807.1 MAG: DNA-binding transcriptional regulator, XRE-family HTH domain [Candidatus Kentron sp. SD]VFK80623.1 MAG: DNA-binding transcriptional regulator, XRE-family HTH domain [Candidatus Kentron sp. SD]
MELKEYLLMKKLSQENFAKLVGVSGPQINRLVKGRRTPSLRLTKRIIKVTGGMVTPDDFKTETEDFDEKELCVMEG